jgi:hypothetical protein
MLFIVIGPSIESLVTNSKIIGSKMSFSTCHGLGISFWTSILVAKSLGLANTSYKVLSFINLYGFNLLMLVRIGLKLNLSMVTSKIVLLGKQYCIL